MNKHGQKNPNELGEEMLRQFSIDYITKDIPDVKLMEKYNISKCALYVIVNRMDLARKKLAYRDKVLEKALNKLATKQSSTLVKTMDIMLDHIGGIQRIQREGDSPVLPSKIIEDVMKIHEIMLKEKRLNEEKPTENIGLRVTVEMPNIPVIGSTVIEDAEYKEVRPPAPLAEAPQIEPPKQEPQQKVNVVVEDEPIGVL